MHYIKLYLLCFGILFLHNSYAQPHGGSEKINLLFNDRALKAEVDSVYNSLSPQQRAAQMIMTASSTSEKIGFPYETAKSLVTKDIAANVVFLKGQSEEFTQQVKELNKLKKAAHILPPLYACDCEPTLLPYKWPDIKGIDAASKQKTSDEVAENTKKINAVLKKVGVQLNFAPVADISTNKSVINQRAFGNNPKDIVLLSETFIKTTQEDGIGATLKHFPGHGSVKGDSHKQSVYIDGKLPELETFRSIIQSSHPPAAVMIGHIAVRNNKQYDTKGLPATLSRTIITGLLREELNYKGIIVTDALNMVAASKIPDADWKAAIAGADIVLMPKDPQALNRKIVDALGKKDELAKQLEQSIKRIIKLKLILLQQ